MDRAAPGRAQKAEQEAQRTGNRRQVPEIVLAINRAAAPHSGRADAVSAGEWYMKHFGGTWRSGKPPVREPRFIRNVQVGPSASLMMDNVNIIIFPIEYARQAMPEWKGRKAFESPKGRVVDHVGFSVENLSESLEKLREDGVTVTDEIQSVAGGNQVRFHGRAG